MRLGDDVYVREDDGMFHVFVLDEIREIEVEEDEKNTAKFWQLVLWNLVFDGIEIVLCLRWAKVDVFDNERQISSLKVFPTRCLGRKDNNATKERLIARGEKYVEYPKRPSFLQ